MGVGGGGGWSKCFYFTMNLNLKKMFFSRVCVGGGDGEG